jgi:hypothetical protein
VEAAALSRVVVMWLGIGRATRSGREDAKKEVVNTKSGGDRVGGSALMSNKKGDVKRCMGKIMIATMVMARSRSRIKRQRQRHGDGDAETCWGYRNAKWC